jgi:ATP-dependent exoDNAse (exonuclease V) alpha subunit
MIYNSGQKIAIDKIKKFIDSDQSIFVLTGRAGTGKTTILRALKTENKVFGATISHQAKRILSNSIGKFNCFTVASLLGIKLNEETGEFKKDPFTKPQIKNLKEGILVVDECSMINNNIMNEIIGNLPSRVKLIFVGDIKQIPPIGEEDRLSPTFSIVEDERYHHELTEIMRYNDNISLLGNEIIKGIDSNSYIEIPRKNNNNITFLNDLDEVIDKFIEDFKVNPLSTKSITYNNHRNNNLLSVLNLNKRIREKLYVDAPEIIVGDLFTFYSPLMNRDEEIIAQNSESFKILSLEKRPRNIDVSVFSNKLGRRTFKTRYNEAYICEVLFEDMRKLNIHIVLDPQLKIDLDNYIKQLDWQMYYGILKEIPDIQYGYCLTTHKCQGSGYDNIYVMEDNIMGSPQSIENKYRTLYTAITRSKKKLVIYN